MKHLTRFYVSFYTVIGFGIIEWSKKIRDVRYILETDILLYIVY